MSPTQATPRVEFDLTKTEARALVTILLLTAKEATGTFTTPLDHTLTHFLDQFPEEWTDGTILNAIESGNPPETDSPPITSPPADIATGVKSRSASSHRSPPALTSSDSRPVLHTGPPVPAAFPK